MPRAEWQSSLPRSILCLLEEILAFAVEAGPYDESVRSLAERERAREKEIPQTGASEALTSSNSKINNNNRDHLGSGSTLSKPPLSALATSLDTKFEQSERIIGLRPEVQALKLSAISTQRGKIAPDQVIVKKRDRGGEDSSGTKTRNRGTVRITPLGSPCGIDWGSREFKYKHRSHLESRHSVTPGCSGLCDGRHESATNFQGSLLDDATRSGNFALGFQPVGTGRSRETTPPLALGPAGQTWMIDIDTLLVLLLGAAAPHHPPWWSSRSCQGPGRPSWAHLAEPSLTSLLRWHGHWLRGTRRFDRRHWRLASVARWHG
ncbi:hypothetical protein Micbo1qcDRAFT_192586 [Microdochium bolleyi]|uniref:Uncharacterized protein n=1 Tax=Microdochium bolleyi TaxID=196109 RepID=A0A136JEQ5_9PEZI|nr:hypothetical protein Micbo1qcDRAFT_192586 [Microdochium bolleyi]